MNDTLVKSFNIAKKSSSFPISSSLLTAMAVQKYHKFSNLDNILILHRTIVLKHDGSYFTKIFKDFNPTPRNPALFGRPICAFVTQPIDVMQIG